LALASEKGGIADVVKDIEKISLIENKDPNRIANVIEEYYYSHSNQLLERENISEYLRENLTMRLSEVFNEVISEN